MMPNYPQHEPTDECDGTAAKRRFTARPDEVLLAFCLDCERYVCDCEYRDGHHCDC